MKTVESRPWFYLAIVLVSAFLVFILKPILMPFAIAALLAYMGDPLVDWLERRRFSRSLAVGAVFCTLLLGLTLLGLIFLPNLQQQLVSLFQNLPRYLSWTQANLVPHLAETLDIEPEAFGIDAIRTLLTQHWQHAGGFAANLLSDLTKSGVTVVGWVANLFLAPVVTFYLLRDWDGLLAKVLSLFPRTISPTVGVIARECDEVLGEFFRGQLLVMVAMAFVYWAGLSIVGLELALLIGFTAGLVSFVPYLGLIVGVTAALIAAFFQFGTGWPLLWVGAVFGVGQIIEGMLLTPWLVGDRIGLHPVAVIFAVLAGGQLFGFLGVLLALPIAAVVTVLLRHLHAKYINSEFYEAE